LINRDVLCFLLAGNCAERDDGGEEQGQEEAPRCHGSGTVFHVLADEENFMRRHIQPLQLAYNNANDTETSSCLSSGKLDPRIDESLETRRRSPQSPCVAAKGLASIITSVVPILSAKWSATRPLRPQQISPPLS
jgi:hypothetical protein